MKISYLPFDFTLKFKVTAFSDVYPAFILRSVMGRELKRFACILKTKECDDCPLKYQCAYSYIFESPIEKNNKLLTGANKASHPFILNCDEDVNNSFDKLKFNLTLFGRGIDYFPYIYYAFLKAGINGLFKRRYLYEIENVKSENKPVNDGKSDYLEIPETKKWKINLDTNEKVEKEIKLALLTPLRIKIKGKYTSQISYSDILYTAARRVKFLCGLYGENSNKNISKMVDTLSTKKASYKINWKEYTRYSARQESKMKLGGIYGQIKIEGKFSEFELSLLKFSEIFGLGKNTGLGFGKIRII